MNKIAITALMTMLLAQPLQAADISGEVRNGADGPDTSDGGFLEIGFRAGVWTHPWVGNGEKSGYGVTLAGEYRYKGLFVEAINSTADGLNLGYQLWNDDQWVLDFIGFNVTSGPERKRQPYDAAAPGRGLLVEGSGTAQRGAGLRLTRYFDDYIFQFRILDDIYRNRGFYSTARVGRSWQYRNWNFHAMGGFEYLGSEYSQRTYGISAIEASRSGFLQYTTGAVIQAEAEVGVTYPVTEHWVFRGTFRHNFLPASVADSPVLEDHYNSQLLLSLSYVF
jgi:outer membrane protein